MAGVRWKYVSTESPERKRSTGWQIHVIRTDHIGRPVFATNDLGGKVWEAPFLPFGGVHVATGGIDLRFPGQWFQTESGLHQNWMRDYDPTTGRYLEADPLGLVDGASVYGYALQNPGRYTDPKGMYCSYYSLPDGNIGIRCTGRSTYNPSGQSSVTNSTENIRDPWPEFDECVKKCMNSEPMLDINSWWPISQSARAQCTIISTVTGKISQLPFGGGRVVTNGCRRDICEEECLSCEK